MVIELRKQAGTRADKKNSKKAIRVITRFKYIPQSNPAFDALMRELLYRSGRNGKESE